MFLVSISIAPAVLAQNSCGGADNRSIPLYKRMDGADSSLSRMVFFNDSLTEGRQENKEWWSGRYKGGSRVYLRSSDYCDSYFKILPEERKGKTESVVDAFLPSKAHAETTKEVAQAPKREPTRKQSIKPDSARKSKSTPPKATSVVAKSKLDTVRTLKGTDTIIDIKYLPPNAKVVDSAGNRYVVFPEQRTIIRTKVDTVMQAADTAKIRNAARAEQARMDSVKLASTNRKVDSLQKALASAIAVKKVELAPADTDPKPRRPIPITKEQAPPPEKKVIPPATKTRDTVSVHVTDTVTKTDTVRQTVEVPRYIEKRVEVPVPAQPVTVQGGFPWKPVLAVSGLVAAGAVAYCLISKDCGGSHSYSCSYIGSGDGCPDPPKYDRRKGFRLGVALRP